MDNELILEIMRLIKAQVEADRQNLELMKILERRIVNLENTVIKLLGSFDSLFKQPIKKNE